MIQRLADSTVEWIPLERPERVSAVPDGAFTLIARADYEAPQTLVALRRGDDLILEVQATEVVMIEGFFGIADVAFYPTPDIAGGAGPFSGPSLTPDSPLLADSPAGKQVVWSALSDDEADAPQLAARDDRREESEASGGSAALLWGGLGLGGLGLVAAVAGGGGSAGDRDSDGSSGGNQGNTPDPQPVQRTVEGSVVAGPVIAGNGLSVEVFEGDGISQLGTGNVRAGGGFSVDVGDYTGAIILRVVDADDGVDFLDEATGADKDLTSDLSAVRQISAADTTVFVNVNPVTTLATLLAERGAGDAALTSVQVSESNAAIAELFGLSDLHGFPVVPINGGEFDASDGLSAGERFGAILAAFSGASLNSGGSSQEVIDSVMAGLTLSSSGAAELNQSAQRLLIEGARTTERQTGERISDVIAEILNTSAPAPAPALAITSGATAPAIDENSGAGQVVYTATATGGEGTVTFSLAGADADAFSINPATGVVTLDVDPDFETQSSFSFTVVATDGAGASSQQAVGLAINEVDTETSVDSSIVVFDLVSGSSSDHSERTFQEDVSYDIYIRVDSESATLSTAGTGPGTWGGWSGANNLGSDDRIVLVGTDDDVQGAGDDDVERFLNTLAGAMSWKTTPPPFTGAAVILQPDGLVSRFFDGATATAELWTDSWGANPNVNASLDQVYMTTMPANILTSQGLA